MFVYTWLEQHDSGKYSNLSDPLVTYEENKVLSIRPLAFHTNIRIGWKGQPRTSTLAFNEPLYITDVESAKV